MELDFDKEIDAIMRNARRDSPVLTGDFGSARHLDADEIAVFAENALPDKTRALYMKHLADCDRCRKILSNLLVMNAEAAPAAAPPAVITIAERDLPWYRKLFLFPNLAYVMGSLVLIFGGFLAFSVIQNSRMGDGAMVSQAPESAITEGGPSFQTDSEFPSANSAANAAIQDMASRTANANTAIAPLTTPDTGAAGPRTGENNFAVDGVTATEAAPPPAPAAAAQPPAKDVVGRDDLAKEKTEDKAAGVMMQEAPKSDAMLKKQQQISNMPSQSGPMRSNENQYNRQLENYDQRAAAKRSVRDEDAGSGRRVVSGKTFERKQGVWYDTAYQNRPTINVRRGTDEYNRLDAGLRSIANTLGGTVVVVWGAKAYRIQ